MKWLLTFRALADRMSMNFFRFFRVCCYSLFALSCGVAPLVSAAQKPDPDAGKKNLLAFTVGGEFIPSNALAGSSGQAVSAINSTSSLSLELNYGRKLHTFQHTQLWLDVPALVGPNHRISNGDPLLPTSDATFYVTPSLRVAYPVSRAITPWVSAGGGYGLFETSDAFQGGASNPTIHTHTGVLQFGGGVDVKTPLHLFVPIGLRGEFRDFYSFANPTFFRPVTGHSQNAATVSGGITARF